MQKNVPKYTPAWVPTVRFWAETSKRDVSYALCNDRRTLLWFANQRAVEYHPTLVLADHPQSLTHLVLDLDPPAADAFGMAVAVAPPGPPGVARRRPRGRRQDERGQGPAHLCAGCRRASRGFGGRYPGHRGASGGPRARDSHDRVHEGRPGRESVRRLDPGRRGHSSRRLQPPCAPRRAGVLPSQMGRSRRHCAGGIHDPHCHRPARR